MNLPLVLKMSKATERIILYQKKLIKVKISGKTRRAGALDTTYASKRESVKEKWNGSWHDGLIHKLLQL